MLPRTLQIMLLLCLQNISHAVAPSNDLFATRAVVAGAAFDVDGTTIEASIEANEPNPLPEGVAACSVWWTWTAPSTGWFELHTTGSAIDTVLAVYRGTSLTALSRVVANDDDSLSVALTTSSRVRFEASIGTVYQFVVHGYGGAQGAVRLAMTPSTLPIERVNTITFSPVLADVTSQSRTVTITFSVLTSTALSFGYFDIYQPGGGVFENMVFSDADRISGTATNGTYRLLVSIPRSMPPGSFPYTVTVATNASDPDSRYVTGAFGWQSMAASQPAGLSVTNTGVVDTSQPVVVSLTGVPLSIDVTSTEVAVEVTAVITDTLTGLRNGTVSIALPVSAGVEEFVAQTPFSSGNRTQGTATNGTYVIPLIVPQNAPSGNARIVFDLVDFAGNRSTTSLGVLLITKDAFNAWTLSNSLVGADAALTADADGDGIENLTEFALNLDPQTNERPEYVDGTSVSYLTQSLAGTLPEHRYTGSGANFAIHMSFLRRRASSASGVIYLPQFTGDLSGWTSPPAAAEIVTALSAEWEWVEVTDPAPAGPKRFSRLQLSTP